MDISIFDQKNKSFKCEAFKLSSKIYILQSGGGTVQCIAVKVAVFYQQVMKLTRNCDFYDFPMPVYARKNICIKNLGNFDYTDTHFT